MHRLVMVVAVSREKRRQVCEFVYANVQIRSHFGSRPLEAGLGRPFRPRAACPHQGGRWLGLSS